MTYVIRIPAWQAPEPGCEFYSRSVRANGSRLTTEYVPIYGTLAQAAKFKSEEEANTAIDAEALPMLASVQPLCVVCWFAIARPPMYPAIIPMTVPGTPKTRMMTAASIFHIASPAPVANAARAITPAQFSASRSLHGMGLPPLPVPITTVGPKPAPR